MSINLNENEQTEISRLFAEKKKAISPQFFSKSLTGSGKKRGLLNNTFLPCTQKDKVNKAPIKYPYRKTTITTGTTNYEIIPMSLFVQDRLEFEQLPDNAVCISCDNTPEAKKIYLSITMDFIILGTDLVNRKKSNYCAYDVGIIQKNEYGKFEMSVNSCLVIDTDAIASFSPHIEKSKINNYVSELTVYDIITATAKLWEEKVPDITNAMLNTGTDIELMETFCKTLNYYSVNLNDYKKIYISIRNNMPEALDIVAKANLNILLNEKLSMLETIKPEITMFTPTQWKNTDIDFSPEQINAITSPEPCCIVQAGAGTGKSTVINNRLKYLKQCNVDLEKVTVLSFTNAAADHIRDIAPQVRSQTIASMIHEIYSANYSHNLSTPDTITNVILSDRIIMEENPVAKDTINAFRKMKDNTNAGLIELSKIAGTNFAALINLLDSINQTTLELESIICYYAADIMEEKNSACEHIILDEVQDNSIFEFIYIINYAIKHRTSLYLVGDSSQTLYEFRASNPKALNCLEMSGIFKCMQLQTNYRSNQNILDFANLTLTSIEANQYAKIQLRANAINVRQFNEDVKITYTNLPGISKLKDMIPSMIIDIKDWIQEKLNNNQQIAFLAYKRRDLTYFEDTIGILFPDATLINIVPARTYEQTFFSKYIKIMGDDYTHRAGNDATTEIMRHIIDNKEKIGVYNDRADSALKNSIAEWIEKNRSEIIRKDMILQKNLITMKEFTDYVFHTLIQYEIEKNVMKLRLTSMTNQDKKEQDISKFNFITSTIHSAKGLEFDNVILLYNEQDADDEESKRMYYVGLTRAKQSEYILAYNANKQSSNIQEAYKIICKNHSKSENKEKEMEETA